MIYIYTFLGQSSRRGRERAVQKIPGTVHHREFPEEGTVPC